MSDEILERIDAKLARIAHALENILLQQLDSQEGIPDRIRAKMNIEEENRIDLMSLYDVKLLPKTRNALLRRGFKTVGQIRSLSARQILGLHGIGLQGLNDIMNMLAEYGMKLPETDFGGKRG